MLGLLAVAAMAAVLAPDAQGTDDASVARPTKAALAQAAAITGVTSVIDGDTIEIHGQRIRFNGIDAPESKQYCDDAKGFEYPCGRGAAQALDGFLAASKPVHCSFVSWDRYARFVGDCRRADGTSVASRMVAHGHALDWPRFSHGTYAKQQAKAEAAKLTLWVGKFQTPWDWRTGHADTAPANSQPLGIINNQVAQSYSCQPRRTCPQISSCDEANWYLATALGRQARPPQGRYPLRGHVLS